MDYNEVKTAKDKLERIIKKQEFPHLIKKPGEKPVDEKKRTIDQKYLVNKLNYLNFQDKTIAINFKHKKYNRFVSLKAKPLPCSNGQLDCLWSKQTRIHKILSTFELHNFVVSDGKKLLIVKPEIIDINDKGIWFRLPEKCSEAIIQKVKRHHCRDLKVQLIQNSAVFHGSIVDFSTDFFRAKVSAIPPQTFQWINTEATVNMVLSDGADMLYSEECKILEQTGGLKDRYFKLKPLNHQIQRFAPKEFRSIRQKVVPSPNAVFDHPFTGKSVDLKIIDLAGSGFSVEEDIENAVLLPGMIIQDLTINFANSCRVKCKAQVIYKQTKEDNGDNNSAKCGLAFLDIDPNDHMMLSSILHQANDRNSYLCNKVDMDALWDFFFETGFIYPKKYEYIKANKDKIKETYKKLYSENPSIGRHFIYQDKGVIMGHMSMLRFYEKSWMIHHHAARKSAMVKAGLSVLEQIGRFTYESHLLYSIHMDYLFCYFRPENRFPNYVFGGIAKNIKNPKGCSLDMFAYFHHKKVHVGEKSITKVWSLTKTQPEDLKALENFYDSESGGLMIQAHDLEPEIDRIKELSKEYQDLGFKKQRHLISLKKFDVLKAIIVVNISDIGLNLSDLTNCLKIFVLDQEDLSKDILNSILSLICSKFKQDEMPVLLYPVSYAENRSILYEKRYNLWILDMKFSDQYFKQLRRLLRFMKK